MAGSLQDQLLKAGLTDAKTAKDIDKQKRKEKRIARNSGHEIVDETREAVKQAMAEKAERDRQLNQDLNSKAARKAINAQIKQLIESNRLLKGQGDVEFNFSDGKKVKTLRISGMEQRQLGAGRLAIVKLGDQYEMVPAPVADKIAERDESRIINLGDTSTAEQLTEEEQEWYKDYEIPDDLMW